MVMLPSLSYRINKNHYVGASLALGLQLFKASGLEAFGAPASPLQYSNDPNALTGNGVSTSYGMGVRVGWAGRFLKKKLTLGANYASKVYMTRFEKYQGLFAEAGKFDIPEHYSIGLAYKINKKMNVAFDIQQINYSDIPSVGNKGPDARNPSYFYPSSCPDVTPSPCLVGGPMGMGFGWDDMTVYKLGLDYKYNKKLTLRAGWNYGKQPIPKDEVFFNMLAPAVVEHHLTLGLSYKPSKAIEYSVNYMHAFSNQVSGKYVLYPDGVANYEDHTEDTVALNMKQDALGFSFGYTFQ
jgi:long-chain fatty acid transport protein